MLDSQAGERIWIIRQNLAKIWTKVYLLSQLSLYITFETYIHLSKSSPKIVTDF